MPRRIVPLIAADPYHITARCVNRERFPLSMPTVWSIMEDYLFLVAQIYGLEIHSFVLMSNHFHLLVTAPLGNISAAIRYFMRETSREISRLSGRINQTYGARNHKTNIANFHYFMNSYKYVYQNPVRAGLCKRVEHYPYSTLPGLLGLQKLIIPLAEDPILFTPDFDARVLAWLNTQPELAHLDEVRLALRRPVMEFKTNRKTGRPSVLESVLI